MAVDFGPRVGADPELFVADENNEVVPICGHVGGDKENPIIVTNKIEALYPTLHRAEANLIGDYAIQEDNVMLEFNIPACGDLSSFSSAIDKMKEYLNSAVLKNKGLHMWLDSPEHVFKTEVLDKYPQAYTIGCLPDCNAYADGDENDDNRFERPPFDGLTFGPRRFCGGHLHVQYNHFNVPRHIFAQFMDCVASLPFLGFDKQRGRRLFYGMPGIYRNKPYGIEYRTLSNFWLNDRFRGTHLSTLLDNVFGLARVANADPDRLHRTYMQVPWDDVQKAIREEDTKLGSSLVEYLRFKTGLYVNPAPKVRA